MSQSFINHQPDFNSNPGWQTVESKVIYPGPFVELRVEQVCSPTRPDPFPWTVARRKAGSMVVPMTEKGTVVMLKQERVPVRTALWEFPAGQIDVVGKPDAEAIRAAAIRELKEETGYELKEGGSLISLGYYFTSQGFTDEHCFLSLAKTVVPSATGKQPDPGEAILEIREFTMTELRSMIASGEIRDANTMCAYARMDVLGLIESRS